MARASILWLMGEYCEHVPKIAPDVLRKMAKTFTSEEDIVKLQIVNLAAKLYLTNSKQVKSIHTLIVCVCVCVTVCFGCVVHLPFSHTDEIADSVHIELGQVRSEL